MNGVRRYLLKIDNLNKLVCNVKKCKETKFKSAN